MEYNSEKSLANEEMEEGDQEQDTIDLDNMNKDFSKETPCVGFTCKKMNKSSMQACVFQYKVKDLGMFYVIL